MKENYHIDDDLLVKHLLGEATPDEIREVMQWIDADGDHKKYYDGFKLIWEESKQFAATSNVDEEASWQHFLNRIHNTSTKHVPVKLMASFYWIRIAAIFIIIAGTALITYIIFNNAKTQMLAVRSHNKVIIDTLPDGSIITLNKNSTVSFPEKFKGDSRMISLQGEAFFSVTPDKTKPFIIDAGDVTVRVVGTSFNIKSINGNTEVIVESGIVQVTKRNRKIELHPEERILIKKEDTVLLKENETGNLYNYYRTREFECANTPLWKLVEVLNEAYDAHIIIERKEVRNLPLTTTFHNESLDTILEIIRQTFNISVTKMPARIILK